MLIYECLLSKILFLKIFLIFYGVFDFLSIANKRLWTDKNKDIVFYVHVTGLNIAIFEILLLIVGGLMFFVN